MTGVGMIMGTAGYMSPEQAKGKAVDKRADIWSFGVVLYEMLTGRVLFQGETASEVMAAVIMRDPDLSALPANVPPSLRYVIARCLVKDPKLRLRDIGEARLALAGANLMQAPATPLEPPRRSVNRGLAAVAVGLAIALIATAVALWRVAASTPRRAGHEVRRAATRARRRSRSWHVPVLRCRPTARCWPSSPSAQGESRLYLRSLGERHAARCCRAPRARSNPVFSPDGNAIAFFATGRLKKTTLDGVVSTVSEAGSDGDPRGIAWLPDDTLVFSSVAAGPLLQVRSTGGPTRAITTLDEQERRAHASLARRAARWQDPLHRRHAWQPG